MTLDALIALAEETQRHNASYIAAVKQLVGVSPRVDQMSVSPEVVKALAEVAKAAQYALDNPGLLAHLGVPLANLDRVLKGGEADAA